MSDINEMRRFLGLVKPDDKVIELRLDSKDEVSGRVTRLHGYYDDKDKALEVAAGWKGSVYLNVNQLAADHPAPNCLAGAKHGECTKAADIKRRTTFYIDFDPVRESGTPSTDEQHKTAVEFAHFIATQLREGFGFPELMVVSSGNGAAIFGRIDLPPDSPLLKRVLKKIKDLWGRADIEVDQKVANVSRICRFIGSNNCKGGEAGRQSKIICTPDKLEVIPEEKLAAFAPEPKKQSEDTRIQQQVTSLAFGKTCGPSGQHSRTLGSKEDRLR